MAMGASGALRESAGSGVRACLRAMCARLRAQCSPPRLAAFGTAVRSAWRGNQAASTSPWCARDATAVAQGARGCFPCDPTSNRRVKAALSGRALHCGCGWLVSRGHQRRRAAWGFTSVATAVASACRGKPSRRIGRLLWGEWRANAGGELGLRGAPRPGRPVLSAQASAGRPARRPRL
jgi:hypothetical protein